MGPDGPADFNLSTYRGGSPVVLLFFPGAFTGGCTAEACDARDNLNAVAGMDAKIVGVSVDSIFAQAAWAKENGLKFPLASDYSRKVVEDYGVLLPNFVGMGPSSERAVFVIDAEGIIRYVEVAPTPGDKVNLAAAKDAVASLQPANA